MCNDNDDVQQLKSQDLATVLFQIFITFICYSNDTFSSVLESSWDKIHKKLATLIIETHENG